jgi:hypothetical protein
MQGKQCASRGEEELTMIHEIELSSFLLDVVVRTILILSISCNKSSPVEIGLAPRQRLPRITFLVHVVDLLQRKSLCLKIDDPQLLLLSSDEFDITYLGNAEPSEHQSARTGGTPDKEDLAFKAGRTGLLVHQKWS